MELAKGVRDFPPEKQIIREDIIRKIRTSFERHGFSPFSSPTIERIDTLTFKFGGEEDVMHELFRFQDQGKRELGLRFDLTVPLCRYMSNNKDVKLPFKRYEIGRVYRDGPIKLGRYREFWQCDADIVGSKSMAADAECVRAAIDVLSQLPFEFEIRINNRKLLDSMLTHFNCSNNLSAMTTIDKLDKQGEKKVREELAGVMDQEHIDSLFRLILVEGTDAGKLKQIEGILGSNEGILELNELFGYLEDEVNICFDPSLARGLNYYTGTVFEAILKDSSVSGSVAGGGRYDNIIGQMIGGKQDMPAVGISIGVDPLTDALLVEKKRFDKSRTHVFVSPIKTLKQSMSLANKIRLRGYNVDIDVMNRSISKNLDYADKLGIPFVVVLGEQDIAAEVFTLKNMVTGEESKVSFDDLIDFDLSSYE